MANEEIKALIKRHRLFRYEVAEAAGISEGYLSTLLRKPLTDATEAKIRAAITRLAKPITNKEENIMNELKNREQRLRYAAEKKGLCIQKQTKETHSGYLIVTADSKLVVAGYRHFDNLVSIEEAEKFVEEY